MENEKQYIEGFNHGYIISQHKPNLAKLFTNSPTNDNPYFKGFISGKQENDLKKIREQRKDLKQNNTKTKGIEKDIERIK